MKKPFLLTASLRSPFARRIRLALDRLNLPYELNLIDVFNPPADFLDKNPLGLVPILEFPDGRILTDSNMLIEVLHENYGGELGGDFGGLWPKDPLLRFESRQSSVLSVGIMTAMVARHLEHLRKQPDSDWMLEHETAIEGALARLKSTPARVWTENSGHNQALYDFTVVIDYMNLRAPKLAERGFHNSEKDFGEAFNMIRKLKMLPAFQNSHPPN